jgi:PAS domain S-box-containing protein
MIRFDELAKAAAGYTRRMRQNLANSRLMRPATRRWSGSLQRAYDEQQATIRELQALNEALRLEIVERKRTEENARLTEEGLQAVIDTIPALVVRRGADGQIEYVNQAWRTFTGLSRGEPPEIYEAAAMHPDDRLHVDPPWLSHFRKGELFETEYRLRRADGEYRWLSVRRMPQRDGNGKVIAWYGVGYDIEDRRRASAALSESKAFLAEAQRLSRTGSFGWNLSSGEIVWSEEMFRIFGYAPSTSITLQLVLDRVHPDDRLLVQRVIDRAASHKEPFDIEHRLTMSDGSIKHLHVVASTLVDESPHSKFAGAVMDITARKNDEQALQLSEQRFRHLFHHTPVALWQLDGRPYAGIFQQLRTDGVEDLGAYIDNHPDFLPNALSALVIQEVNDHAIKLFGARDRQALTDHPTHWMWRESIDTLRRSMESRWRGEDYFQETTKLTTLDGRVIDVLYTVARPPMVENLPITLVSMIDMTERVRAQDALRQMQADFAHAARVSMLGELTASIAHEINQPLAAIASTSQASLRWLAQPTPNIDKVRKLTTDVTSDVERAAQIISRIRAMATGRIPEPVLLCPDDVIREALLYLRHEVATRREVVSHLPAINQEVVLGDRTQLQQVIVNLAINAVQAIAQAGSAKRNVSLRTVWQGPTTLRCSVEDSGPGIAPRDVARLFDSFFTTKSSGMGMGLRICRSVIEAHGGSITADNESSLGGARFYFTLPVAVTTSAQAS